METQYLNKNEGTIIEPYFKFLESFEKYPKFQILEFDDGTKIKVEFLGFGESDNDLDVEDENYEEFYEFYYKIQRVCKNGYNHQFSKGETLFFNYKNFPNKWSKIK